MDGHSLYLERLRYRNLAYKVIRDAIGFYLGIPKFLESASGTKDSAFEARLKDKINRYHKRCGNLPSGQIVDGYRQTIEANMCERLALLNEDLDHCRQTLFEQNVWLDLLELEPEFIGQYLDKLSQAERDNLAVVPNWNTLDESLGRPYINNARANEFSETF